MTHNTDNEAGLIGAVLRDPAIFEGLNELISPVDFSWDCYSWAWQAFQRLHERGLVIDTITLGDELERMVRLEEFAYEGQGSSWTGRAGLAKVREQGDPSAAESYAYNVLDYSAKKRILAQLEKSAHQSLNGRTASGIIQDLEKEISQIRVYDSKAHLHTVTLAEAVSESYDATGRAAEGKEKSVKTGYLDLDKLLKGMTAPDVLVIAGRPGQGKTAFLGSVVFNSEAKTAFFTLEMSSRQIAMRLLAMESGISFDVQKSGQLAENEWPQYVHAVEKLADNKRHPVMLNDLADISISRMRRELRRMKSILGGLDLIVLDYIQLAGVDGKYQSRVLEVGEVTRGLKSIAKEFDVPVLAAAQLSRSVETRHEKRPILSDLRESGSIENDADVVMFIYRPDQYDATAAKNTSEIIVAKHRNGPVGTVELAYRPNLARFESLYLEPR